MIDVRIVGKRGDAKLFKWWRFLEEKKTKKFLRRVSGLDYEIIQRLQLKLEKHSGLFPLCVVDE